MYLESVCLIQPSLLGKTKNQKQMTLDAQMNDGLMTPKDCRIPSEGCYDSKTVAATA